MSRARRSLSSTASSSHSEESKPPYAVPEKMTDNAQNASTDLEDGEIADEATLREATESMEEVVVESESSSEHGDGLDEEQASESLGREREENIVPRPSTPGDVETLKSFDGSEEHSGIDSAPFQPTSSMPTFSPSDALLANSPCARASKVSSATLAIDSNSPIVSEEELEIAKDVVLDLLGWGVQPEYLIEYGISSHAIYRIFTDLHLRLPSNLSHLGPG